MNATIFKAAAGQPAKLAFYLWRLATHRRALARFFSADGAAVARCYRELSASDIYRNAQKLSGRSGGILDAGMFNPLRGPVLYLACRLMRPETVVETGVADGCSSCLILAALAANGKGNLRSIDLPNQPGEEIARPTGWLVPPELRSRWELIVGDARNLLPPLLERLGEIDLFFHDSDHSYENMTREFGLAWAHLKTGGALVADDVTENRAFRDFTAAHRVDALILFKTGLIIKR